MIVACSGGDVPDAPSTPPQKKSVILICLDTLRADRMSLYGYEQSTTPNLETFAQQATRYDRALAASPWTLPSHGSLFTGLYPYEHGARTYRLTELQAREGYTNAAALDGHYQTVAELLVAAGYRTGAIAANTSFLDPKWGLEQGFEHFESAPGRAPEINGRALAWLDAAADPEQPFFLFLNYMDTHRPYNTAPREGWPAARGKGTLKRIRPYVLEGEPIPADLQENLHNEYDLAIANLDAGLGELFTALRERGHYEDSWIGIVSDHGEFLGEHGLIEHAKDVYQPVLHVPLIVKEPGQREAAVDEEWISHVHLPVLLFAATPIGEDVPQRFQSHWPRGSVYAENYGARQRELEETWGPRLDRLRRTVLDGEYKFIDSSDGVRELYDLAADPGEQHNLIDEQAELASSLAERLRQDLLSRKEGVGAGAVQLSAKDIENMQALGYMGDDEEDEE